MSLLLREETKVDTILIVTTVHRVVSTFVGITTHLNIKRETMIDPKKEGRITMIYNNVSNMFIGCLG